MKWRLAVTAAIFVSVMLVTWLVSITGIGQRFWTLVNIIPISVGLVISGSPHGVNPALAVVLFVSYWFIISFLLSLFICRLIVKKK
jgi:hypothetical protein